MKITIRAPKASLPGLLGVGCFEGDKHEAPSEKKFLGKEGETFLTPLAKGSARLLIGLGKRDKFTLEKARRASARLLSHAKSLRFQTAFLDLGSFDEKFSTEELAAAAVEGVRLSDYRFEKYKSKPSPAASVSEFTLILKQDKSPAVRRAVTEAETVAEAIAFTRDIANEPANVMTPPRLAEEAKKMARANGLRCTVFGKEAIKKMKMGGLIGVSQGSIYPPQLIILENSARSSAAPVVLVGKGITFDTGGISIKPSADMDKMKFDMCGAAAVLGAMKAIANLKLPVHVVGIAAVCENMPGSTAQRPGDIIRAFNGKTIEVLNTDAEGRLVLADALSYAKKFKPRALVDIATLTGACAATFADIASGVMSTDPDLLERLKQAGEKTGERLWELPLWDDYFDLIKATYADIQNISKKYAGTITAGMFLKEFADHTNAWAHLDVAGTAWADRAKPLAPIGATGIGVRLFVELVKTYL